jgi:anti-sigma factor RsiW
MTCAEIREILPAYALGEGTSELRAEVQRHLDACDDCARLEADAEASMPGLDAALAEAFRWDRIRRRLGASKVRRLVPFGVAAAALIAAILFFQTTPTPVQPIVRASDRQSRLGDVLVEVSESDFPIVARALGEMCDASGDAVPMLWEALARETDPEAKYSIMAALDRARGRRQR